MKKNTKKEMQKELNIFRKLSMNIVANKIFLEYRVATNFCNCSIEPEGFVEECLKTNFPKISRKMKNIVWKHFLMNLVMNKRKPQNEY